MKIFNCFLLILIVVLFVDCKDSNSETDNFLLYETGAEFVFDNFLTNTSLESRFKGVESRTQEFVRSGEYAVKVDSVNPYGLNILIDNPKEGELFQASVWQKHGGIDGTLYCVIESENNRTIRTFLNRLSDPVDGWVQHKLNVIIGAGVKSISFYVFTGHGEAYFDDIEIKRFFSIPEIKSDLRLNIHIPEKSQELLEGYIKSALSAEIISKKDKKYVNAFIIKDNDSIPIEMRLKGDWTDHLTSGKTSFRIKIKGDNAFMGLKTFSIQHPNTRNNMHEWFMHKLCDKEGLLSTTYEFLPVSINGVNKGVYAIEEHFDKQLLESRNRREGPILKYDESGFWALGYMPDSVTGNRSYPYYSASFISLFKKKRTLKNKLLKQQFIEGAKLLNHLKNHSLIPQNIFDIKTLAKYYALMDLGNGTHAMHWHNRRFYFNPITQKVEHIGFDILAGSNVQEETFLMRSLKRKEKSREFFIDALIFRDVEFRMYYIKYLKEFSSEQYLDSCFLEFENEISINEKLLGSEMLSYKFKKSFYYKRSLLIHDELKILDSLWDAYMLTPIIPKQISSVNYHPNKTNFYIEEVSINAYRQKLDSANYQIDLENYHLNDIKIIGYTSRRTQDTIHYLKKPILMKGYKNISSLDTKTFLITQKPKEIVFEIKNDTSRIFKKSFLKWQKPIGTTAVMDAEKIFKLNNTLYNVNGNQITFKAGKLTVKELIVFPPKFSIHIYSGTTINFINGGGLVVNNSINIIGTEADSVKFISTDKNNNGLTILNGENVKMEYVSFINIQALHYKTWNLTGAVTIYETDANLKHVYIGDNDSEDALNIIRSNFIIENLRIENTVSDGFDADFCSGEIINSIFKNTGNDCIDFSGSKVSIENIDIQKSGDKGISGGEKSELFIKEISIDGAITGVASKDGSIIKGDEVSIKNTEYGFAAFKKKPEYNVAKIEITKVDMENIETNEVLIDLNSQIILNGKLFLGKVKLDIDQMYARFEK